MEQDEWTQSKLRRREQGLEEETFEVWKEQKQKDKDEEEKKKNVFSGLAEIVLTQ